MKKIAVLLIMLISLTGLTACASANVLTVEMEMDADYSHTNPFENGRLFCVSEDMKALDAEVSVQMDGERGTVEIKDRNADDILWSKTWEGNVKDDTVTILLENLQKDKEYVVRFTGFEITNALIKVTFDSNLVQEKERPSK